MTTWTERPSHRHWLRTETLRLLDFGRGAMPTDRGPAGLTRTALSTRSGPPSPGSTRGRRTSTLWGTCSVSRGAAALRRARSMLKIRRVKGTIRITHTQSSQPTTA
jgi:hypothetical protein